MAKQADAVEVQVDRVSIKEIKTLLKYSHTIKRAVTMNNPISENAVWQNPSERIRKPGH